MLYIVYQSGKEIHWHVGEKTPELDISQISEVQADGHELIHVCRKFENIPQHVSYNAQQTRWFGDFAKFIAGNL